MRTLVPLIFVFSILLALPGRAAASDPTVTVQAPTEGSMIMGTTVKVTFATSDIKLVPTSVPLSEAGKHPEANHPGEGHLHFALDLQPLVVWVKGDPYTFANVPPGDHTLMVELVNNDHSSLSPRVMKEIHFRTEAGLPHTGALPQEWWQIAVEILAALSVLVVGFHVLRRGEME